MSLLKEALNDLAQDQNKKRLIQAVTGAIEALEMRDDTELNKKVERLIKGQLHNRPVESPANSSEDLKALLVALKNLVKDEKVQ